MPVQCNYDINYLELLQTSEAKGICGIPRLPSLQTTVTSSGVSKPLTCLPSWVQILEITLPPQD